MFGRELFKVSFPRPINCSRGCGCRRKRTPPGEILSPVRVVAFSLYTTVLQYAKPRAAGVGCIYEAPKHMVWGKYNQVLAL